MARTCESLTVAEIVFINRRMCETSGGLHDGGDNFANRSSLDYILNAIHESYFGEDLYPTIARKAAAVGSRIITGHVFHDANKRVGLEVCRQLLELNGYLLPIDQEAQEITLRLADGKDAEVDDEAFAAWVSQRATPL